MNGFLLIEKDGMDNNYSIKPYMNVLRRAWAGLLAFGIVGAMLAYAITSSIKPAFESHFSYLVSLSEREEVPEYQFDGFYALQATDLFAATLARWAGTPEVIVAAHDAAGISLRQNDPRQVGRIVRAEKTAPQLVEITVRHHDSRVASALVHGLQAVMDENIDRYHDEGIPALRFRVVATEPWQGSVAVAREAITLATFVFVVFVGANIVLLAEAFRNQQGPDEARRNTDW